MKENTREFQLSAIFPISNQPKTIVDTGLAKDQREARKASVSAMP
jgi:hypothetical protein